MKNSTLLTGDLASDLIEARADLTASIRNISGGFSFTSEGSSGSAAPSKYSLSHLRWNGGDVSHQTATIDQSSPEKWKLWESSLATNPAFLTTEMSLIPISELVDIVDSQKTAACREALHDFLGGKFTVYRKMEEEAEKRFHEEKLKREEETDRQKAAESVKSSSRDCFPSRSLVIVKGLDEPKLMQDLAVGDEVLALDAEKNELVFSPVYMFGHRNPNRSSTYLEIRTPEGNIFISEKHLIFKEDNSGVFKAVLAEEINPGDKIFRTGPSTLASSIVNEVRKVECQGVYAPFTVNGTIVVDGTLASCYAHVKRVNILNLVELCPHATAHWMLAPLRGLHSLGWTSQLMIKKGEDQPEIIRAMAEKFNQFLI